MSERRRRRRRRRAAARSPGSRAVRLLMSATGLATVGASLTVTVKLSETVPPLPSSAVTVIVAVPRPIARTSIPAPSM